ncbi:MAG TPA: class I SAM-dependent methyltransferase [Planctomycetaceae bacterium]|nr:class I SAM-dependent methyltransferase [Planctomycetaceae bacterium]
MSASTAKAEDWDPAVYSRNASFVANYGKSLIDWLRPQQGENILDLGCGDGVLTQELAACGADVIGVDASPRQIDAARRRGVRALVVDGHELAFSAEFDAVFSNAALHWMQRPDEVLAGVVRALKPGGRFVGEFGGEGNVASIVAAMKHALQQRGIDYASRNPWYYPSAEEYRGKLEHAGFRVDEIVLFSRPTPLPGDITGWLETFAPRFTVGLSPRDRTSLFNELADALRPQLFRDGKWIVDYVRLRFRAALV